MEIKINPNFTSQYVEVDNNFGNSPTTKRLSDEIVAIEVSEKKHKFLKECIEEQGFNSDIVIKRLTSPFSFFWEKYYKFRFRKFSIHKYSVDNKTVIGFFKNKVGYINKIEINQ